MQYVIMVYEPPAGFKARTEPHNKEYWPAWTGYSQALGDSGLMKAGNALLGPDAATTVRRKDGKRMVQDGPFPDTKEQLGGYFVIEADHLDVALEWAGKCPVLSYGGAVEVRPVMQRQM